MPLWAANCSAAMNLISTFLEVATRRENAIAIVDGNGGRISYRALSRRSAILARHWRDKGVRSGDRVLVAMPLGIELYASIAALWRLGATIVFPEPSMGLAGLKHAINLAQPTALLATSWYRPLPLIAPDLFGMDWLRVPQNGSHVDTLEEVSADHPALISFTSGSTGTPKCIVRSHAFLSAQNACVSQILASDNEIEIDLVAFPVFVIANLGVGNTSILPNWKLSRHDKAEAGRICELIRRESITRALVPPSICETLADANIDPNLDTIFTGGGPIFPDLMRKAVKTMPDTSIVAVYGSTEAEPISHQKIEKISPSDWTEMENGRGLLAGFPIEETSLMILGDEIVVTGDHVNKSYLNQVGDEENKIDRDGQIWHRTGDAGQLDEMGRLWLRGRVSAKAGDFYPFEIEVAARCWAGVKRVALVPGTKPAMLAIEGDQAHFDRWKTAAEKLGDIVIRSVDHVPLDKRHKSKVDYTALRHLVSGARS